MKAEILKDMYWVAGGRFHYTSPTNANLYLIDGGKELALIDAGSGIQFEFLLESLWNHGFDPKDISLLIITHAHWDHARGAKKMKDLSNCKIAAHELAVDNIEKGDYWDMVPPQPVKVDIALHDGDNIDLGNYGLQVIHVPGHTPEDICLLMMHSGKKVLFSGDSIKAFGNLGAISAKLGNLGNLNIYRKSIEKIKVLEVDVLLPGHGVFILADACEQINFLLDKMSKMNVEFVSPQKAFESCKWEYRQHQEWSKLA